MKHRVLPLSLLMAASLFAVQAHAQGSNGQDATDKPVATSAATTAPPDPGVEFLSKNAHAPGVVVLPSGLQYKVIASGPATGVSPKMGDEVQVVYEGRLLNGKVFDHSTDADPAALEVGQLVPGWNEALQLMHPGDEWELYIPSALGYGDEAKGPIPGNSVMIFKMKLLAVGPLQ